MSENKTLNTLRVEPGKPAEEKEIGADLKSLQADILKIDGCFVRDIETDPLDAIMVKSIIEMAKVKKMKVVAEYVETPEQREKLLELGVDYLQGYLVGKPLPLSELRA